MDCIVHGVSKSLTRLSEFHILYVGFPGGTVVKNPSANAGDTREAGSIPGSGRSLEEGTAPTPVFLPGKPHVAWRAAAHGVAKSQALPSNEHSMANTMCVCMC